MPRQLVGPVRVQPVQRSARHHDRPAARKCDLTAMRVTAEGQLELVSAQRQEAFRRVHQDDAHAVRVAKRRGHVR
jgi:hypothetical protein